MDYFIRMLHAAFPSDDELSFSIFYFIDVGVGGYTYLLEPLWWAGMVLSKYIEYHCKFVLFSFPIVVS